MVDSAETSQPKTGRPILSRRVANYVRFALKNVFILISIALISLGSPWVYLIPVFTLSLLIVAEELIADIDATEDMPPTWYLNLALWLSLPLLGLLTVAFMNMIGPGLPPVDAVLRAVGIDPDASRASMDIPAIICAVLSFGSLHALAGLNVAHELVHRADSKFDVTVGKLLLGFTFDTGYAIDHVYGHHKNVGTEADPSTARRGEYALAFVVRSTIGQNINAWRIEHERLKRKGIPDRLWTNRYWRGWLISLSYVVACYLLAGWKGVLLFSLTAIVGKAYHTLITYVEHYGLVRVPGTPVQPRHAWNSNRRISLGMLYNAPLHAEHHMFASRPFWKLQKVEDGKAPLMPHGSVVMFMIAFTPPLWNHIVKPRLADWDRSFASEGEREYLRSKGLLLG